MEMRSALTNWVQFSDGASDKFGSRAVVVENAVYSAMRRVLRPAGLYLGLMQNREFAAPLPVTQNDCSDCADIEYRDLCRDPHATLRREDSPDLGNLTCSIDQFQMLQPIDRKVSFTRPEHEGGRCNRSVLPDVRTSTQASDVIGIGYKIPFHAANPINAVGVVGVTALLIDTRSASDVVKPLRRSIRCGWLGFGRSTI